MTIRKYILKIELTYDLGLMHHDDAEGNAWFREEILGGEPPCGLVLHSNEIGDEVGEVKVLEIISQEDIT